MDEMNLFLISRMIGQFFADIQRLLISPAYSVTRKYAAGKELAITRKSPVKASGTTVTMRDPADSTRTFRSI
jgi:hypothetical protein